MKLLKPEIGEQAATKLISFSEEQRDKSVDRLWIAIGILTAFMMAGFGWLGSEIKDIRNEVKDTRSEIKAEMKEIRSDIKELRKLILQKR